MLHKLFFEPYLVRDVVWNNLHQAEDVKSCCHWPTFSVSPSVKKFCKIQSRINLFKRAELEAIIKDLLLSSNIILCYTEICNEIFLSITNSHLTSLIIITSGIAKHFLNTHEIDKIEHMIDILQSRITENYISNFKKTYYWVIGSALTLGVLAVLLGYNL